MNKQHTIVSHNQRTHETQSMMTPEKGDDEAAPLRESGYPFTWAKWTTKKTRRRFAVLRMLVIQLVPFGFFSVYVILGI